jgi:hypothetical protein
MPIPVSFIEMINLSGIVLLFTRITPPFGEYLIELDKILDNTRRILSLSIVILVGLP